jgi:hypothetical protein
MVGQNLPKIQQATAGTYQTLPFTATEYEKLKKALASQASVWNWMLFCLGPWQCLGYFTYPAFFLLSFFITTPAQAIASKLTDAFDFKSLITALDTYVTNYASWDYHQRDAAWLDVGKAQREVPVHIANEYCRHDRSFDPCPGFNELTLPRVLTVENEGTTGCRRAWFPLTSSSAGLGFDFGIVRLDYVHLAVPIRAMRAARGLPRRWGVSAENVDLAAVRHLDKVRTADLTETREILNVGGTESWLASLIMA